MQHTNIENEQNAFDDGVNIGYEMGYKEHADLAYCSGYYDGFERAVTIIEDKVRSLCNVRQVMEYLKTLKSKES